MKKKILILTLFGLTAFAVSAQKTALQYLDEAPLAYTKDICSSSKLDYLKFKAKLDHYCAKIQEDIDRRKALSTKIDLSVEAKSEIYKLMKELTANTEKDMEIFMSLSYNSPYPGWLSEEESSKCLKDKHILTKIIQFNGMLAIHAAKESDRPNSPAEGIAAQNEYCTIMTPKCKQYLERTEKALRASLPKQQRLGELEYSGPAEVKEIDALGVVYSYLSSYADVLFEGNIFF
jgi:hypothetical protein